MNRDALISIVERLFAAEGSDDELRTMRRTLQEELPESSIMELIYYPDVERSPIEVVEEALRRTALPRIALTAPGTTNAV